LRLQCCPVSMRRSACADFYMSLYNVVFTMLAPLVIGTIDQDVNRATSLSHPGARASNDFMAVDHALQNRVIASNYAQHEVMVADCGPVCSVSLPCTAPRLQAAWPDVWLWRLSQCAQPCRHAGSPRLMLPRAPAQGCTRRARGIGTSARRRSRRGCWPRRRRRAAWCRWSWRPPRRRPPAAPTGPPGPTGRCGRQPFASASGLRRGVSAHVLCIRAYDLRSCSPFA